MIWILTITFAGAFSALITLMVITMKEEDEYWEEYQRERKH